MTDKARFYQNNPDIFIRYFDSPEQYEALIAAGNFKKMEAIIKENSAFSFDEFVGSFIDRGRQS